TKALGVVFGWIARVAGWYGGAGGTGRGTGAGFSVWLATPRNGMLLTVSNRLPTPSVGRPVDDWESVVRLISMKPRISWSAIASRKTLLGSSIKPWKLSGNGPVLW